jgi:spore coat polysaccharide biosynthesis protein SpsF
MTTAIIIQARFGSTRLPGKVLLDLSGKTVLAHVLERALAVRRADVVVCAVPEGRDSDPVAEEARAAGVVVVRGDEHDVLGRYLKAARAVDAATIMRITSDCPLIDPSICDAVLELRAETNSDYACNNMPPSWPHGLDCEVFTRAALEGAARLATRPSEREHVSQFIRYDRGAKKAGFPGPGAGVERHRWTLDTPKDLEFLRALFARLPAGRDAWDYRAPLTIVEADPALARINIDADRYEGLRKSLAEDEAAGHAARIIR